MAGSVIFKPTAKASSTSANKTGRILFLHRPDGATWPLSNSPNSTRMFLELRIPNYIHGLGKSGDLGHGYTITRYNNHTQGVRCIYLFKDIIPMVNEGVST